MFNLLKSQPIWANFTRQTFKLPWSEALKRSQSFAPAARVTPGTYKFAFGTWLVTLNLFVKSFIVRHAKKEFQLPKWDELKNSKSKINRKLESHLSEPRRGRNKRQPHRVYLWCKRLTDRYAVPRRELYRGCLGYLLVWKSYRSIQKAEVRFANSFRVSQTCLCFFYFIIYFFAITAFALLYIFSAVRP